MTPVRALRNKSTPLAGVEVTRLIILRKGSLSLLTSAPTSADAILNEIIAERATLLARQPGVRFLVAGELFALRVPLQLSPQADGDDAQMTDRDGAMANLRFANRLLPRAHAVEEILHVIVADVERNLLFRQRLREKFRLAGFDLSARQ